MVREHQLKAVKRQSRALSRPVNTVTQVIEDKTRKEEDENHDTQYWINDDPLEEQDEYLQGL